MPLVKTPFIGSNGTEILIPRRPLTSYIRFCQEIRADVVSGFGDKTFVRKDISDVISSRWKELSEEDRAAYNDEYRKSMDEFNTAIKELRETHPETFNEARAQTKKERSDRKKRRLERNAKGKRVKKVVSPMRRFNPFMVYSSMVRKQVGAENPGIKTHEMSTIIGGMWRGLSEEARKEIIDKAHALAKEEEARQALIKGDDVEEEEEEEEPKKKKVKKTPVEKKVKKTPVKKKASKKVSSEDVDEKSDEVDEDESNEKSDESNENSDNDSKEKSEDDSEED